ncbi:hypothetical protein TRFO_24591 [Tritrichomonas foetus]|uniref:SGF29 C-terminal domain-containing protein n=1 Tax=Tritrichomonas foetus TaxID=1144522 RepID=A0A1J4K776_9EUKA|nr:hypothetical protein TRFO_24591 [Tritrichomonas foetus]|eukprot:OHT07321.1 hypothetical protein TRFO_24591 [Tritrichomonas foetus]
MTNKLRNGSNCAACVLYPETESHSWILTKVEKKLPGNRYLVRDEFADDPRYETYTVESNHITPFPSSSQEEYRIGETVLALWRDEETNEWSTMFYSAEVQDANASDPKSITLLYSGTSLPIEVEKNKIARLPNNFTFVDADDEPDDGKHEKVVSDEHQNSENVNQSQTEEKLSSNQPNQASLKGTATTTATTTAISTAATTAGTSNESSDDESRQEQQFAAPTTPANESTVTSKESTAQPGSPVQEGHASTDKTDSSQISVSNDENAQNQPSQKIQTQETNQQQQLPTSQSNDQIQQQQLSHEEEMKSSHLSDKLSESPTHNASKPAVSSTATTRRSARERESRSRDIPSTPEDRRIYFMFHKPEVAERPKLEYLTNEDFTRLAGPRQDPVRMKTIEGTPLLDSLEDPELFNQECLLHVTGSGEISISDIESGDRKSGIVAGQVPCGRLSKILNEWTRGTLDNM